MENMNVLGSSEVIFHDKYDDSLLLAVVIGFIICVITYTVICFRVKSKRYLFKIGVLMIAFAGIISLSAIAVSLSDINIRHTGVMQYTIELKGSATEEELSINYYWKKIYGNRYWIIEKDKGITEKEWHKKY